jgi:hypothetical protein
MSDQFDRQKLFMLVLLAPLLFISAFASADQKSPVDSVKIKPNQVPLLTSGINNLAFTIRIYADPGEDKFFLRSFKIKIDKPELLRMVKVIGTPFANKSVEGDDRPVQYLTFGSSDPSGDLIIEGNLSLVKGENIFHLSLLPVSNVDLLSKVTVRVVQLTGSDGWNYNPEEAYGIFRMAKILRSAGQENVHTYRIPGFAVTKRGTLIAVYDNRYNNDRDLQDDIDVGMSRSTDGGQTWEPMKVIMDMGNWGGLPDSRNGIGDPAILVDNQNNTIWVAALWIHGNYSGIQNNRFSQQGLEPLPDGRGSQLILVKSVDDGVSWSQPINITKQTKNPEWGRFLQGPGCGITMNDGTLVFPAQYLDPAKNNLSSSNIIYSKDHGKSWQTAKSAVENGGEAQVVECSDGLLMLNMRSTRKLRLISTSSDLGTTWQTHPTSALALPEPGCQASLIKTTIKTGDKTGDVLLFSNPDHTTKRADMTIKASLDQGETWPSGFQIKLNENTGYGYSCMAMIDSQTVGIVYEGVRELFFQKISVKDIIATTVYSSDTNDSVGFRLAPIFSEHMVFQQKKPVEVYGFSNSNDKIEVFLHAQYSETRTGSDGKWKITMPPLPAGGPYILQIRVNGVLNVDWNDIMSGEVWFCSGQSNMEFELKLSENGQTEAENASDNMLRLFNFKGFIRTNNIEFDSVSLKRINNLDYFEGLWQTCSPETASEFSAIGYYFGKNLRQKLKVPVGLILVAVGGAPIEAFTDRKTLEFNPVLVGEFNNKGSNDLIFDWVRQRKSKNNALSSNPLQRHPYDPAYIFEAGIEPLGSFPVQGVIWYQGESNAHNAELYRIAFTEFVHSWRKFWHNSDLPVFFAQLSSMDRPLWPRFRDVQRQLSESVPNTALVVTSDLGDSLNVHPVRKKQVGERFALQAFNKVYGLKVLSDGPTPLKIKKTSESLIITFKSAGKLKTSDGKPVCELEIAGQGGIFRSVNAVLKRNRVTIIKPGKNIEAVRYGWKPFSHGNLVNEADLPASTFLININ